MLLNSNRNTEYVARADGGFARGQATEDFWQKPAGSSSSQPIFEAPPSSLASASCVKRPSRPSRAACPLPRIESTCQGRRR